MTPIVDELRQAGYPVRTVNVDREPQLAARYQATSLPCFVMVAGGREVDRVVGATSSERLLAMLAQAKRPTSSISSSTRPPATFAQQSDPALLPVAHSPHTQPPATQLPVAVSSQPFRPSADRSVSPRNQTQVASAATETFAPQRDDRWQNGQPAAAAAPPVVPIVPAANSASTLLVSATGGVEIAAVPRSVVDRALAASVRLKVEDAGGRSWGSGTIVDVSGRRALIVTCAHIFRDSGGNSPVSIDLYGDNTPKGLTGTVLSYDLPSDVALLTFDAPSELAFVRVAPDGHTSAISDPVVSVGCGHGTMPTAIVSQVVSVDRFLGPPNLQVAGQPVQGRSGGGLFSEDGYMIGVCNAADPQDDQGLYAALGAIHAELDRSQLSTAYAPRHEGADILLASNGASQSEMPPAMPERRRAPTEGGPVNTAARGAAPLSQPAGGFPLVPPASATIQPAAHSGQTPPYVGPPTASLPPQAAPAPSTPSQATPSQALPLQAAPAQAAASLSPVTLPARQPPPAAGLSAAERGALDAIERAGDDAEVIVIVRSRSNPAATSQIIVVDHASPALLRQLSSRQPGTGHRQEVAHQPSAPGNRSACVPLALQVE
jgi:hypothetical protein